ncbi:type I polyketide synthase [Jidongwangia harbinensis]|uniref:type I polyketide synthase n=1 Tax=Jidongwangia harbinensis TaxID=2878561 RepID=UPI00355703DE
MSATDGEALRSQAERIAGAIGEASLADVAFSLATGRAALPVRAVVVAADADEAVHQLGEVTARTAVAGRTALLFTGQGSQWSGMGRELYDHFPAFADTFDGIAAQLDLPLHDVVFGVDERLDQTEFTQAALFAYEVSMFRLLESWGVKADVLAGHSIGEVAAAYCAGLWSLEDACRLVAARGRLMQALPAGGAMVAIQASEDELAGADVDIAAVNGPRSLVISGPVEKVEAVAARFAKTRRLEVSHAFHSSLMDPMLDEFRAVVQTLAFQTPSIALVKDVSDPEYWVRHVRDTVRFADDVAALSGVARFVEVGPDAVLLAATAQVLGDDVVLAATSRSGRPALVTLFTGLGQMWSSGGHVDWNPVFAGTGARRVDVPTYGFRRDRYWPEFSAVDPVESVADAAFWRAVEREDLPAVAGELGLTPADQLSLQAALPVLSSWRRSQRERDAVDSWRYQVTWQPVTMPAAVLPGRWLLVGADVDAQIADAVTRALTAAGAEVATAGVGEVADLGAVAGVVSLLGLDVTPGRAYPVVPAGLTATVRLLQGLPAEFAGRVWCVTRGAVAAGRGDGGVDADQARLWGLGRVAALEMPLVWGGLVDLPDILDDRAGTRLAAVLASGVEDQVAIRSAGISVRRLTRTPRPSVAPWAPRGTVLVTGGTGGIGATVARWLAGAGAARLVLTSRRGLAAPGAQALVDELAAVGVSVEILAADMTDRVAVARALEVAGADLSAVVHSAGTDMVVPVAALTEQDLADAAGGKVAGARYLDELLGDRELDAFVVFSSIAGAWGSGNGAAYAAANAYLDAIAADRRRRGLAGTAIAWGPWSEVGMAVTGNSQEHLALRGLTAMAPATAVTAIAAAVAADPGQIVAQVDWPRFVDVFTAGRPAPLLAEVAPRREAVAVSANHPLLDELAALPEAARLERLVGLVRAEAAVVLGHADAAGIAPERAFREVGFDSLTAVELRNRLRDATGLSLPATLVFDHPSPLVLAGHLRDQLIGVVLDTASPLPAVTVTDDEPIVIVGMACRYPGGVTDPQGLWDLVAAGGDAVAAFPDDRGWDLSGLFDADPDSAGTSYASEGGFLEGVADFDAGFFGISPREALAMDPQQRLLLETGWESIERAGIDPRSLRGSRTGVFVGTNSQDYPTLLMLAGSQNTEGLLGTGNSASVVSGRLSYTFGLEGPAVTVDTACSSSLVALHLAAQSIRQGECDMALAGGVVVMATPGTFIEFSRQRGLATDGRCKAFSDDADGTGWAEGAGMLLLERLSDARRNGHQILAVIAGTAVNQDGASNGLTAPNGPAQQRVIRQALANARLTPADVDVVEAHGTGTTLGDPIEAQAVLATYGQDRETPLWLGSLKSNIGHAQAASGVGGIIKMVMALRHGLLPKTLHISEPSTKVDWSAGAVNLLTESIAWQAGEKTRRAGISSFGMSGTNAHVIIEEPPTPDETPITGTPLPVLPVVLSGRSPEAVRDQAARLTALVRSQPDTDLTDLAYSLATTRAALEERAGFVITDRDSLLGGLASVDPVTVTEGGTAFLFTGQGAQRPGMGRDLYDTFPVFADTFDEIAAHLDLPLHEVVFGDDERLHQTQYTQAALFAFEVALFRLLESWGVRPDMMAGHSIGEVAAAYCAGVWSLADACRLVAARGSLMQALPAGGAMVAIQAAEEELAGFDVDLAAVNGPRSVVVSGPVDKVEAVAAAFARSRRLEVSHAFHSSLMDPMLDEFRAVVESLVFNEPTIPLVKDVSDPDYWVRHVRETVRFADDMSGLHRAGARTFVEVGPDGVLSAAGVECVPEQGVHFVPTVRRGRDEIGTLVSALTRVYVVGGAPDWAAVFAATGARRTDLPTYAFQRRRYWPDTAAVSAHQSGTADNAFWQAIEDGDLHGLSSALRLRDGEHESLAAVLPALATWRRDRQDRDAADAWRYRVTWTPVAAAVPSAPAGRWLVLTSDGQDVPATIAAAFARHGGAVERFVVEAAESRATLARRFTEVPAAAPLAGVLSLLALDPATAGDPDAGRLGVTVRTAQALDDAGVAAPLWCATRYAVSTGTSDAAVVPEQAQVWGLSRVIGLENPGHWGGLVDLPGTLDDAAADRLIAVLAADEDEVAIRPGRVFGRRLAPAPPAAGRRAWQPHGTVLVTGGTGGIGAEVARWLATEGAERLILTSRRGPAAPGVADLTADLVAVGAKVEVIACDADDRDALGYVLAQIPENSLTAVVHAAGVSHSMRVDQLDDAEFAAAAAGKVAGARHLDELLGDLELEAFVVVSTIASVWGSGSSGAYAAAGAYLDGLVANRRARGLAATAVAFGPWAEVGLSTVGETAAELSRRGLRMLPPRPAAAAVGTVVGTGHDLEVVADVDWSRFAPIYNSARAWRLLDEVPEAVAAVTGTSTDTEDGSRLADELAALPAADREPHVVKLVTAASAAVLGHDAGSSVPSGRAFRDLGFDSLTAVELRNRLNAATGLTLPAALVFDYPTPAVLAAHLVERLAGPEPDGAAALLAELDRIELGFSTTDIDSAQRSALTDRLQRMLARCTDAPAAAGDAEVSITEQLESATSDDIFDLIDRRFGTS